MAKIGRVEVNTKQTTIVINGEEYLPKSAFDNLVVQLGHGDPVVGGAVSEFSDPRVRAAVSAEICWQLLAQRGVGLELRSQGIQADRDLANQAEVNEALQILLKSGRLKPGRRS